MFLTNIPTKPDSVKETVSRQV